MLMSLVHVGLNVVNISRGSARCKARDQSIPIPACGLLNKRGLIASYLAALFLPTLIPLPKRLL